MTRRSPAILRSKSRPVFQGSSKELSNLVLVVQDQSRADQEQVDSGDTSPYLGYPIHAARRKGTSRTFD